MNSFVLFMILVVTLGDYLVQQGWLPGALKLLPEAISAAAALAVIVLGARTGFRFVRAAYWIAFGGMAVIMVCGAVVNAMEPGPVVAGIRSYLRALPLFFLPAVYAFNSKELRAQLTLVTFIGVLQFPIAMHVRIKEIAWGNPSGDLASGTLLTTGIASIVLVCLVCVLAGCMLRGMLKVWHFVVLMILLLATTAINETKVTFLLVPAGLLVTYWVAAGAGQRLRNAAIAAFLVSIAGIGLASIYDYFVSQAQWGISIVEFVLDRDRVEGYVYFDPDSDAGGRERTYAGRGTSIVASLTESSSDPVRFGFGLGIGNASESALGPKFSGAHFERLEPYMTTLFSAFMLEIGYLGVFLALAICYLVFRDSRIVANARTEPWSAFAVGWAGVTVLISITVLYVNHSVSTTISYLFWYGSGLVAAHRMRLVDDVDNDAVRHDDAGIQVRNQTFVSHA
jgi:hypothetical protein